MQKEPKPSLKNLDTLYVTFFGAGFAPLAPGTVGALLFLPFLILLAQLDISLQGELALLIVLSILASLAAQSVQKRHRVHDPGWIVIDEVVGVMVTWLFRTSDSLLHLFIIFFLFRAFDIAKIWPASFFDRKVKHGFGTIADDLVSGLYAGGVYLLLTNFSII